MAEHAVKAATLGGGAGAGGGPAARPAGPCAVVMFGATGDLARRKLLPALYNLAVSKLLPRDFAVVGVARRDATPDELRTGLREDLEKAGLEAIDDTIVKWLGERLVRVAGDGSGDEVYAKLGAALADADRVHRTGGNRLFYLSVSPDLFSPIVEHLGRAGLAKEAEGGGWRRVVVEKPFGRDLDSARGLNRALRNVLSERQIYRIDHYLGKETVQNILVFRFSNGIFEPIWDRRYVDHVQITAAETLGVEQRAGYYERAGALRDMVPNHIFQLLTLTAMEPPSSFEPEAVRNEQVKVLDAVNPITPEEVLGQVVRGQYGAGLVHDEPAAGYREEPDVAAGSATETYVALELRLDNWRWADVPFYVRTGKRLPQRVTEITIQFKRPPLMLLHKAAVESLEPNRLVLRLQPDEGISLSFGAKRPGPVVRVGTVDMDFRYADYFGRTPATGYERLLYDAMLGDATLFQRADQVEASWRVVTPILDVWQAIPPREFPNYSAGTWGPAESDKLLARDGRAWRPGGE